MSPETEAEQALLGALLLAPEQIPAVAGWLQARHFHRPAHATLYEVLLAQHAAGHAGQAAGHGTAQRQSWALEAMGSAMKAGRGFTPGYGHTLLAACPVPAHASSYGRMVLESAVRRVLHEHAHRLMHAARTGTAEAVVELTGALRSVIGDLADAWGAVDEQSRPLPGPWPLEPADGVAEETLRQEAMLLASATASPGHLPEITRWLHPGDFLDGGHRTVYQSLAALARRGEPIDALTVLWEARHQGAIATGAVTADGIRALTRSGWTGDPGYWAEQVLGASLLRSAAASAGTVRLLCRDTSLPPGRLLGSALHVIRTAAVVQQRWHTAHGHRTEPAAVAATPPPAPAPPRGRGGGGRGGAPPPPPTAPAAAFLCLRLTRQPPSRPPSRRPHPDPLSGAARDHSRDARPAGGTARQRRNRYDGERATGPITAFGETKDLRQIRPCDLQPSDVVVDTPQAEEYQEQLLSTPDLQTFPRRGSHRPQWRGALRHADSLHLPPRPGHHRRPRPQPIDHRFTLLLQGP
ncbi:hypothetical protein KNE206_53370 [Kitasatospora sp. NE20-6]|uniref:DnaB-like helicase N-terminal domain-containing protein n=1 Tax=Kitasatospora sp. NE20-6 TaxID=2859066 RepID=UPI0034DC4C81